MEKSKTSSLHLEQSGTCDILQLSALAVSCHSTALLPCFAGLEFAICFCPKKHQKSLPEEAVLATVKNIVKFRLLL